MDKKETEILKLIKEFAEKLPKFPDGRIDYHNSDTAPVVDVFVKYQGKILILKRSNEVSNYQGKWNCISGYLLALRRKLNITVFLMLYQPFI